MSRKRYVPEELREMQTAPGMWPVKGAAKSMRDKRPLDSSYDVRVDARPISKGVRKRTEAAVVHALACTGISFENDHAQPSTRVVSPATKRAGS